MKHIKKLLILSSVFIFLTGCNENTESDVKTISLGGPDNDSVIELMNDPERRYIDAMHNQEKNMADSFKYRYNTLGGDTIKIKDYLQAYSRGKNKKVKLGFSSSGYAKGAAYYYHLSTKEDFSDEIKFLTKDKDYEVQSLKVNTKYYWKVTDIDNKATSLVKTFITKDGTRGMDAGLANNVRDIGGHLVKGNKRIKQGLIYRGSELNDFDYEASGVQHKKSLNDEAIFTLKDVMHVGTEIDLRGVTESNGITSSNLGWSVKYDRQPISGYGGLISDRNQDSKVKKIFKHFITASEDNSVYFHCMGGADRTGTIAFLLGGLLGMSYTDLVIDFELTSYSYNLREHDVIGEYSDFPSLIEQLKVVSNADEMYPDIQSMVEYYLVNKVGLTTDEITSIKTNMLEDID